MLRNDASPKTLRRIALAAGLALGLGTVERPVDAAGARAFWIDGVGGATPAETITVYFNPKELTADKSVPWKRHRADRGEAQTMEFAAGEPYRAEVVLLFETHGSKTSVLEVTGALEKLAVRDPDDLNGGPHAAVEWNGRRWVTKLLAADTQVTDRAADGTPLAASVVTLWSAFDEVVDPPPVIDPIPVVVSSPQGKVACELDANSARFLTQHPGGAVTSRAIPVDRERGLPPGVAFVLGEPQRLHLDLLFDTLALKTDVRALTELLQSIVAESQDEGGEDRRPTRVAVTWGTLPEFEGVVQSVSTKYTMFLPDGTPVRATCTVRFKEADRASFRRGDGGAEDDDGGDDDDGEEEHPDGDAN
jgi:hypothetical protein